jgi:hypothetical protein
VTSKLAYTIYEDRIKEEARIGVSLGDQDSDWRRAEAIIRFCESPKENTWQWGDFLDDNFKYIAVYERLKCQTKS